MKKQQCEYACSGIPVDVTLAAAPGAALTLDVRFRRSARNVVRGDDAAFSADWSYLADRIRRVAAVRRFRTAEALAEQVARLVFADENTDAVEVAVRGAPAEGPAWRVCLEVRRGETELGPRAPAADSWCVRGARLRGAAVKALARPFHAILPDRRWTMPAVDPARRPPRSETPIPRIFWQTNFTDRCSLPVWWNYRRNRRLSDDFEHRYLGTDERAAYVRAHAPERVVRAYERLVDGAAQADLWRLVALHEEGGVYLDIDGSLAKPLSSILAGRSEVFVWDRKRFTNYFLATVPKNPVFAAFLDRVVERIETHHLRKDRTVFYVTGPGALESVLDERPETVFLPRRSVAVQGLYTDEKYQYIDRPRSKWTYKRTFMTPPA